MADDPIDSVYAFVERAYIRMQAGEVLIRCLEDCSQAPIQQMVEGLVLAGPQNLATLREILAEVTQHKSQVQDDLHQVLIELRKNLISYGVDLEDPIWSLDFTTPNIASSLSRFSLLIPSDIRRIKGCKRLLNNGREVVESLAVRFNLLEEIELYLEDWLLGLAYKSARQEDEHKNEKSL